MPTTPQRIHQLILLARAHNWRAEPLSIPLARDAVALLEHSEPSWMHGAGYVEYAMALSIHGDAEGAAVNVLNEALDRFGFLSQSQRSSVYFYMVEICLRACDHEGAMVAAARSVEALRGLEHLPLYLRAAVRRALMCGYAGRVDAEERAALLARLNKELESGNKMLGLWGIFVLGVAALSAPGEEGRALLVRAADAAQDYEEMRAFVLYYVAILDHIEGRIGAGALEAARPAPELLDAEGETVAQLADALVSEAGRARWIAALAASPSQGQAVVWEGLSAGVAAWGMVAGLSAAPEAGEALRLMGRIEEALGADARYMHPLARRLAAAVRERARGARWRLRAPPRWVSWLEVGPGGAWFRCDGGERVAALSARSSALANIVWTLAGEAAAGRACDAERLIEAGWPGEQIMAEAAANRLYMAISTLRRRGLAQVLITVEGGYTLRPDYALALCVDQQQG